MPHLRQVERIDLHRYDPGYLLPRGGARQSLLGKRIVLVGCGAVGSALAVHTASMGCGSLLLVDHDRLSADNIHRHALGALYVGAEKAGALAGYLRLQFPHLHFDYRTSLIETVIKEEPELLEQADLVFLALGNETIELLVNDLLRVDVHRIHAWVDPLGLGGHVLAIPKGGAQGCYRCLFGHSEQHGLFNRASFVAPGQQAQRTFSGCAGFFTPFSYQDADQTALLAARQAAALMSSPLESRTILTSWYGNPASALEMGLSLSDRAKLFEPCRCASTEIVSNSACACSQW
jgi:molybdopterin/thiamine biosynthesis adenylyltransferase